MIYIFLILLIAQAVVLLVWKFLKDDEEKRPYLISRLVMLALFALTAIYFYFTETNRNYIGIVLLLILALTYYLEKKALK
ncbi:MAG: hypothetical protein ACOYJO_00695 [Eubacterium sp.]